MIKNWIHIGSKNAQTLIADRAYEKWMEAGRPLGDGKEFWLAAEQELTHSEVELEEVIEIEL